ncbi:hypothetical protein H0G86_001167 [Trichoderma simmonsii]|uniref:Uncharacterized protein n=1 Tax=Trichoderma simmonsii TaxID=1491479 RepID=A0A8G0L5R7_9HYPO|nr:hypothetical protein H0G86_001167 [Trichoderma simmonsii]
MAQGYTPNFPLRNTIFHADDYFYEEKAPASSESLGGFKTTNPLHNRFQRQMIHISPTKSKFKKTVELVLCIHGWENPDRKVPMTLVVVGVNLSCHARNFRFQSLRIRLRFSEDNQRSRANAFEARPQVVAYAPFVQEQRWNTTVANVNDNREFGGKLGVNQFAQTEMSASRKAEVSYMRKHFDRGSAHPLYSGQKAITNGVEWYCEQNELQKYGILPNFHLAVLLERSHHEGNAAIPFQAEFDMWTEAGFMHDFEQGLRRAFRLLRPEDDPVYFDPSKEKPDVYGVAGVGEKLLENIRTDNLGALRKGMLLSKLIDSAGGALAGLEPMEAL